MVSFKSPYGEDIKLFIADSADAFPLKASTNRYFVVLYIQYAIMKQWHIIIDSTLGPIVFQIINTTLVINYIKNNDYKNLPNI